MRELSSGLNVLLLIGLIATAYGIFWAIVPRTKCVGGKIIIVAPAPVDRLADVLDQRHRSIIMCGDVWYEGKVKTRKLFPGVRKSAVEFVGATGKSSGTCSKEATEFYVSKNEVIGYCKKHAPNCSCQWPYDSRPADRQEAYDTVVVQDVTCS